MPDSNVYRNRALAACGFGFAACISPAHNLSALLFGYHFGGVHVSCTSFFQRYTPVTWAEQLSAYVHS